MISTWFRYNWQARDEWFDLWEDVPQEELARARNGGPGSILFTLLHILDVEYSWLRGMQGKPDTPFLSTDYQTLAALRALSDRCREEIQAFLAAWSSDEENVMVTVPWTEGRFTKAEALMHVIAHEIHHMGQLSIWAREMGLQPVSANVIGRGLF